MSSVEQIQSEYLIEYSDVEICRDSLVVLKHVNFKVLPGEFIYLLGKVGSGKSSLLKTLYHEIPLTGEKATIFDIDLLKIKNSQVPHLRRQIGIVFQDFQLLTDRNVRDNLLFVLKATGWKNRQAIDQRIEEVLEMVGMSKKDYKMPHELSGGQQQRVAIARALLNRPRLILADEPTGNLDPETAANIMDTLYSISKQGTAVVMATHNHSFTKEYPAKVYTIDNKNVHLT